VGLRARPPSSPLPRQHIARPIAVLIVVGKKEREKPNGKLDVE